jgi:AraC-like DNA-binding protein
MDARGPSHEPAAGASPARAGPAVLAAAAPGIVSYIEKHRGDVDSIFGNSGLAPEMAGATMLKLRLGDFCTLFEQAARRTRFDNFGLWFGNQFQPRDLGLWGYAAVSAPTLGAAIDNLVELFGWHQESSLMRFGRVEKNLVSLEYQIQAPDIVERRQDAELSLGMFLNVIREACGPGWSPEEVHFEHPRPAEWKDHERAFGAPVYFAQGRNALLFHADVLERPMPGRDLTLMTLMRNCLIELGRAPGEPRTLIDAVRGAVRNRLPSGYPSLEAVAGELRVPQSAVQRALGQLGVSFKDLVEHMRYELALAYLRQRHLSLSEIAFLLGYSELSAFSRAVRRWTGRSPRQLREGPHLD